jgi:microcompartment protein CcmL/EutN
VIPSTEAIGLIELTSIARGLKVLDGMVKRALVTVVQAGTTHPGKYTVLVRGQVEAVGLALAEGRTIAGDTLIDRVFLPNPHEALLRGLEASFSTPEDALLVVETYGVASAIRGADAALKMSDVGLCALGLARDLGGKGYFTVCGALHDLEAAEQAAVQAVGAGLLFGTETIARPHSDTLLGIR